MFFYVVVPNEYHVFVPFDDDDVIDYDIGSYKEKK